MNLKPLVASAILLTASFISGGANASVVEEVNMTFASGATFSGDVTFANDFSSYTAVTGTLSGGPYGVDSINWVWDTQNWSTGASISATGLWMDLAQMRLATTIIIYSLLTTIRPLQRFFVGSIVQWL
jgi:hypothetical protein